MIEHFPVLPFADCRHRPAHHAGRQTESGLSGAAGRDRIIDQFVAPDAYATHLMRK